MKIFSAIATATFTLLSLALPAYSQGSTSRDTSSSGSSADDMAGVYNETATRVDVPIGTKTYNIGLRTTEDGPNRCGGALITPTHALTSSSCMIRDIRWASVGTHYYNGTQDGERIKVVVMSTHPKYADLSNDLMVLELEMPSSFEPVALAAADGSDIKVGEWGTVLGWKWIPGDDTTPATRANELQSAHVKFMANEQCSRTMNIDDTMVCVGGLANEDPCQGNIGSPVIVRSSNASKPDQDVVVGVVSWGVDCNLVDTPSVLARLSTARTWVDSVTANTCTS